MGKKRFRRFVVLLGVAVHFRGVTAAETSFAAQFDGTNFLAKTYHTEGNIFEIVAKNKPVSVARFDINMDAGTDTIEIQSRPGISGTVVDLDDGGWTLIKSFPGVIGQGKNNVTPLPDFDVPVVIPAGSKQAFYITSTMGYQPVDIWYNVGSSLGSVYAVNDDLEILEGYAVGSFNGNVGWTGPRRWNGIIHYSVPGDEPTSSPVPTVSPIEPSNEPSSGPTTSPSQVPSYLPTGAPLEPTKSPSSTVCQYPSSYPSLLPTAKFLSSSPTVDQSESPSNIPSALPSAMPSSEPSSYPSLLPTAFLSSSPTESPSNSPSALPSVSLFPSSSLNPTASSDPTATEKPNPKLTRAPFSSAQRTQRSILACLGFVLIMGHMFVIS